MKPCSQASAPLRSWEHGFTPAAHTVYARSHEVGQIDRVAFDADADIVDFRYYGTREQIYMVDGAEGVIIGNYTTGQTLILLDTKVAELSPGNFLFHFAQAREDRLWSQLGFDQMPDSQVIGRNDIPTVGTNDWPTSAGPGAPPSGETGTTYQIEWNYGVNTVLDFDPAADRLDFVYFRPSEFSVAEVDGSVVITILGQNQTYTLDGVALSELDYNNILAVEDATYQAWRSLIEAAQVDEPSLSVGDTQIAEGDAGQRLLTFTVRLSVAAAGVVTVDYSTLNGTALAGSDYQAAIGKLIFQPGETTKTVQVAVNGDASFEFDERFDLVLSSPSGAKLADERATGTLVNDDAQAPGVPPAISIADLLIAEGDGAHVHFMFMVTLDKASTAPVTVQYRTANGTALAGGDFAATTGTITFAPGETSKQLHVDVIGDLVPEADERFTVVLSAPTGATIADGEATGTIRNDDEAVKLPSLAIANAQKVEGDDGTVQLNFTVTLSEAAAGPVTVRYVTADGTAIAGSDYDAKSGTLTFAPGETSKVLRVTVNGDTLVEANETLTVKLSNASGATIHDGEAVGTIRDDDVAVPLPSLAIANAQKVEGDDGTVQLNFTVTLSDASSSAVTVRYATANGTAIAGSDYDARSGTLTFAPGETSKVLRVTVNGDTLAEANETLAVKLSNTSGATIHDGEAIGTIRNDDVVAPTLPKVSASNTSVVEGDAGAGAGGNSWFSTSGNQIVDAAGNAVKIAGVNWFGFESSNASPHGVWTRPYTDMMDQMKDLGFNTIRLPFSTDTLHASTAGGIDYSQNADLQGLTPLEIMDRIVAYAGEVGLKVILDHHRSSFGGGASENGLWYDAAHSESQWVDDWQMLAARYAGDPTVIGADLHNEPHAGTWGGGGPNDWAAAAERAGNAIGVVNPNWLIFVEGIGSYQGENYWWGGNLMGVRDRPIELDVPGKLVYSAHDYGNSVYAQPWFQGPDFAQHLPEKFDEMWGYIYRENIAPVFIGEFGTKLQDPKDAPWLEALASYMAGDFDNDGTSDLPPGKEGISWTYWSWNPNSLDTGGILEDDWRTVHTEKLAYLEPIQFDFDEAEGGDAGAYAAFTVGLSAASDQPVTVNFHTVPGDAEAGDFTAVSGSLTFAPGETSKIIRVAITGDNAAEPNEHFSLVLTDAHGAVLGIAEGVATIVDDDGPVPAHPTLSVADAGAQEGSAGTPGFLSFTVSLSAAADGPVSVHYATANGSALAGQDYQALTGTLTFAAGETSKIVKVPLIGDSTVEGNETFSLALSNPSGATIADGSARGTIQNDDAAPPHAGGTDVDFQVADNWGSGFVGSMTLTAEAALNGWTVEFDAAFDISNIWNAEIVSHAGDHYVIGNTAWNGQVGANGEVNFGFQASPGGSAVTADDFVVNGHPVGEDAAAMRMAAATPLSDDLIDASVSLVESRDDGFTAEVVLHNDGTVLHGWTLAIETPYEIAAIDGAEIVSRNEDGYVLRNVAANADLAQGGDVHFELVGRGTFDSSQFDILI